MWDRQWAEEQHTLASKEHRVGLELYACIHMFIVQTELVLISHIQIARAAHAAKWGLTMCED